MDNIAVNLSIDEDKNIIISIDSAESIIIETEGDIELSEYMKQLSFLIEKTSKISINQLDTEDPKLHLIQKTINEIATSFNESIDKKIEQQEDAF